MKGIQFWAGTPCRSVMATYECIAEEFGVPFRVICENDGAERFKLGWDRDEHADMDIVFAASTFDGRLKQLDEKKNWAQWFSGYQKSVINCKLIKYAADCGCAIGIGSESPNNGTRPSFRRMIKNSPYYWWRTRWRVRDVVHRAAFIANYSGDETLGLQRLGWPQEKIIPFGYFPPPLTGGTFRERTVADWADFSILVTGVMDWRRGQDDVITAMSILKRMGYSPRVVMTQKGELYPGIEKRVREEHLNVELVGFAEYEDLLRYHSECSVYVASGRREPWGMRINDALNAGSPLIVSRGMGGVKLVNDYGCGRSYYAGDALDLAWQLKSLMDSSEVYLSCVEGVSRAVAECSPKAKAQWLAKIIRERFPEWR